MPGLSEPLSRRLRALRARAVREGARTYELVVVGGVPVSRPRSLGSFSSVADALAGARRFGVSTAVVRTWADLPDGVRVHVNSVEWLLSWHRVAGPLAGKPGADSRGVASCVPLAGRGSDGRAGANGVSRFPTSKDSRLFHDR